MTREEAIKMLRGMKADNLNLDDLYTKDKYNALDMAIKAIEQEHCEDAVSRKELMGNYNSVETPVGYRKVVDMEVIKNMPSVTPIQRWIPCSERLPKPGEYVDDVAKYYLVQNEYGDMLVARYTHSEYWEQIYRMEPIDDEIVAWMPLPEPYKAEMESELWI